jgi:hypothetical protein
MRRHLQDIAFAVLVVAALALAALVALVWRGHFVAQDAEPAPTRATTPAHRRPAQRAVTPRRTTIVSRPKQTTPKPVHAVAAVEHVTLRATRGDCWVSAHSGGSSDGAVLAEQLLPEGESLTVHARKVWLSLGAAGNVDVFVNGRPRPIPSGTTSVVLG